MTKATAVVPIGELECAMGRDDHAAAGDHTRKSARVATLTSMCRNLTAELFADEAQLDGPGTSAIDRAGSNVERHQANGQSSEAGPQSAVPESTPAADAPAAVGHAEIKAPSSRRADITIPPPPPHWPAWPSAADHPVAVAPKVVGSNAARESATGDTSGDAARDLAALQPRRFGAPAPAAGAPNAARKSMPSGQDAVIAPPVRAESVQSPPVQSPATGQSPDRTPSLRLRRAPIASSDSELPALPKFLDPGPLVVTRQDRPAWINTGTKPPAIKSRRSESTLAAARRLTPAVPRARFGAFAGVLMFVVVAGVGVAAAALAPQIASLMPQGNAPQILVEEVEGVSDAIVPLSVSVDPADGTVLSTVVIDGVPEGARLSVGRLNTDGSWVLPPEELADLSIMPPRGFAGEFNLEVRAVAVDGAERIGQSETMHIVIMPSDRTPQIRYSRRT